MKEQLKVFTPAQLHTKSFSSALLPEGSLPHPIHIYKTALAETRSASDLDIDPVADIVKRFQAGTTKNIAEVHLYKIADDKRFRIILTTEHANDVLKEFLMDKDRQPFKRLLLDATGKVTAPINGRAVLHHVLLVPIPKSDKEQCFLVPV